MKNFKNKEKNPMLKMINEALMTTPMPTSMSFLWNMGSLAGVALVMQIITGMVLSMNYIPSTSEAYESVVHIMRDVDGGWLMRYLHMNSASMMFMLLYIHMARGVYFSSPKTKPMVWVSGMALLVTTMATAFMGYVLPWGQMSYWGATVITSMISAIPYLGEKVTIWLWGGFSIAQPTLNRFFSLHFMLPMVIFMLMLVHLIMLHHKGSSNPTGTNPDMDSMKFYPYFLVKDLVPLATLMIALALMMSMNPNLLGDVENFNMVSTTTTPVHIQPEWYFLFAYTILRAVPSKLGGVAAMMLAVTITLLLTVKKSGKSKKFSPVQKVVFFSWVASVLLLTWLGGNPVEEPYSSMSKVVSVLYFSLSVLL